MTGVDFSKRMLEQAGFGIETAECRSIGGETFLWVQTQ